jgi:hypothetical protein
MPKTALQKHIESLIEQHGGLRSAAKMTGIDHAYLWRLKEGKAPGTSDKILKKLGLQRVEKLQSL